MLLLPALLPVVQPPNVLSLPEIAAGVLDHIDEFRSHGGEYILYDGLPNEPLCDQLNDITEEMDAPIFGQLPDSSWLMFDPRMILDENTPEAHIPDGGGLVRTLTGEETRCANVPRTFLNEEQCTLSDSDMACGSAGTPNLEIELNAANIATFHTMTGQYVYAIDGLPLIDVDGVAQDWPCKLELRSRWEILNDYECTTPTPMGDETNATLVELLLQKEDSDINPFFRDIIMPIQGMACSAGDENLVEIDIVINNKCFRRVHPNYMDVYDFTYWTLENTHPGNMVAMMRKLYISKNLSFLSRKHC